MVKEKIAKKAAEKAAENAPKTQVPKPMNMPDLNALIGGQNAWKVATAVLAALLLITVAMNYTNQPAPTNESQNQTNTSFSPSYTLTITEFSDFQCPYCKRGADTMKLIKKDYEGYIEVVFKHFPLTSIHPQAWKAAEAAECARDQGKFWEMHNILFSRQTQLDVASLKSHAAELGLDMARFNNCLDNEEKRSIVERDVAEASSLGLTGAPSFFIEGEKLVGAQPYSVFQDTINLVLAEHNITPPVGTSTLDDPPIRLTVINDEDCSVCNASEIIDIITTQIFPTANVSEISFKSQTGKNLVESLGIQVLPAYVFDSAVSKAANYGRVEAAFIQIGTNYLLHPASTGSNYYLSPPQQGNDPSLGPENASITIIEYSEFQCPYCGLFVSQTHHLLLEAYPKDVRIVFKNFPLSEIHPDAEKAAEGGECANEQGMFWEYHDLVFENQENITVPALKSYAQQLGLNTTQFDDCLDSGKYADEVEEDYEEGLNLGVSGTPSFFVNKIAISGAQPLEVFQLIIDSELNKTS